MGQLLHYFAKGGATYPKLHQIRGRFPREMRRMSAADGAFAPHQSVGEMRSKARSIGVGPSAISHNVYYVKSCPDMAGPHLAAPMALDTESATCVTAN